MSEGGPTGHPAYTVYRFFWRCLDWLYPPQCTGCGEPGSLWCDNCLHTVRRIPGTVCHRCGKDNQLPQGGLCQECREHSVYGDMRVWGHYEGRLRDAILSLKYHKNLGMGNALSQPLIEIIRTEKWKFDMVIPVPLSAQRHFERGYNQVSQLAFPISLCLGLHYRPAGLRRIRNTASQVGLTGDQRRRNVIGAFQADHGIVGGRSVLLVDDVTTTGTTLDECSLALVSAGVKTVYAITLARAGHLPVE